MPRLRERQGKLSPDDPRRLLAEGSTFHDPLGSGSRMPDTLVIDGQDVYAQQRAFHRAQLDALRAREDVDRARRRDRGRAQRAARHARAS